MSRRVLMTYELAQAAAKDHANRHAKAAGRTRWNEDDYNALCAEFDKLYPLEEHLAQLRAGQ